MIIAFAILAVALVGTALFIVWAFVYSYSECERNKDRISILYAPKPDITAYELALITAAFGEGQTQEGWKRWLNELPPEALRHLEVKNWQRSETEIPEREAPAQTTKALDTSALS